MIIDDINEKYIIGTQINNNLSTVEIYANHERTLSKISCDMLKKYRDNIYPPQNEEIIRLLNSRLDEISKQQDKLKQERNMITRETLTTVQAVKNAVSEYLKGADKELDQQAIDLKIKQDEIKNFENENLAYGKEYGFNRKAWRYIPEIFKGKGLRCYEETLATVENKKKIFELQEVELLVKKREVQEQLQSSEAYIEIAKKSEEYLRIDKDRIEKLKQLDCSLNDIKHEEEAIIELMVYHRGH